MVHPTVSETIVFSGAKNVSDWLLQLITAEI